MPTLSHIISINIDFNTIIIGAVFILVVLLILTFGFPKRDDDWPKDPPY